MISTPSALIQMHRAALYRRGGGVYFAGPASRRPRSSTPWGSVRTEDFRLEESWPHDEQTIGEIDVVAFTEAIAKTDWSDSTGTWPAGTTGTVVSDYGDHKEVEIVDADNYGATLDMPVVPVEQLKLIEKHS
jgi:hypothetical protein